MSKVWTIALLMGLLRLLSGFIELSAGSMMIYFNKVETALKINSFLALVGPTIMIIITSVGLCDIADNISVGKMLMILCGVALIFLGLHKL